mmetsp:Transcript_36475/g.102834  ORF Transcript_36475/g.102834 Transcript_36475/m.102834 type:complete len:290 (-) Transcript_36475:174-1043(-)
MAAGPEGSLFANLRGVTVRNTFLEFEDAVRDLPEGGFARQTSEPVKPSKMADLHASWQESAPLRHLQRQKRQVSEQTTTSWVTLEDSTNELEEGYFHSMTPDWGPAPPPHLGGDCGLVLGNNHIGPLGGMGLHDLGIHNLGSGRCGGLGTDGLGGQAPLHSGYPYPESAAPPQPAAGAYSVPRFCPNCGSKAEHKHFFCAFCCYRLKPAPGEGAGAGGAAAYGAPQSLPVNGGLGCGAVVAANAAGAATPHLLTDLRRFRYVEAATSDVELAHVLYLNYKRTCEESRRK